MDASKGSIEDLIIKATSLNQELYYTILEDASIYDQCGLEVPSLLRDMPELRMDLDFIHVELFSILQACFATDRSYEKRYHLKNLYAGILESYKLLYGFDRIRKRTIWARIGTDLLSALNSIPEHKDIIDALRRGYDEVTRLLLSIESTLTEQDNRNLTYHYDDDLLLVYRLTLKTDNEEDACQRCIEYMNVIRLMRVFSIHVEHAFSAMGYSLPKGDAHNNDNALTAIWGVAKELREHNLLNETLLKAVDRGSEQLDLFAKMKEGANRVEERIGKTLMSSGIVIPEIAVVKDLMDIQMLVSFMMADAATILRSFICASGKVECPMALKRLTISRVSTLNHLIGYKKEDSDSMWERIISVIPNENSDLLEEAYGIKERLLEMRMPGDGESRALFVHLIDNHKNISNVPSIIHSLEDPALLMELQATQDLIKICGSIRGFLNRLMDTLSIKAKEARIESKKKLTKQMERIKALLNNPGCPEEIRDTLHAKIDEMERYLKEDE